MAPMPACLAARTRSADAHAARARGDDGVAEVFRGVAQEAKVGLEAVQNVINNLLLVHAVEVIALRTGVSEDFHAEILLQ